MYTTVVQYNPVQVMIVVSVVGISLYSFSSSEYHHNTHDAHLFHHHYPDQSHEGLCSSRRNGMWS